MRGPIHALENTRIIGTYLRVFLAFVFAGLLAIVGGMLSVGVGGLWGLVGLFVVVVLVLLLFGLYLTTR